MSITGSRYCDDCYARHIAPACAHCHLAIIDTISNALGKTWHPACLTCALCNAQLQSTFYLQDHKPGVPYCSFCIKGVQQQANQARRGGFGSLGGAPGGGAPGGGWTGGGAARMHGFQ